MGLNEVIADVDGARKGEGTGRDRADVLLDLVRRQKRKKVLRLKMISEVTHARKGLPRRASSRHGRTTGRSRTGQPFSPRAEGRTRGSRFASPFYEERSAFASRRARRRKHCKGHNARSTRQEALPSSFVDPETRRRCASWRWTRTLSMRLTSTSHDGTGHFPLPLALCLLTCTNHMWRASEPGLLTADSVHAVLLAPVLSGQATCES